jgi:CDP-diacylglycerol--glycerol-3-phosphate 3-phosphatidyltransferase
MLLPVLSRLRQAGVTPNALTWMAILLSGGLGYAFMLGLEHRSWFFLVAAGLLLRMALNALDGMMARQFNMTSNAGAILNELGDIVSDALVMWPLALLPEVHIGWVAALLWMSAVNECAGVLGASVGGERRYEGPMGKSDRTLVWGVFCLLLGAGVPVEGHVQTGLCLVLAGLCWSTFRRVRATLNEMP